MPDVKFSNQYPYTDFHELNLDWVIKEVKYWSTKVGKTIQSIELTGTVGLVDTYTITYSDGTTSTFDVTNGNGIVSIAKTGTAGNIDTYTITLTDGSTSTFTVTNGAVTSVNGATGAVDDSNVIAAYETSNTATRNYNAGKRLIINNTLYRVVTNITAGDTLTVGTNIFAETVDDTIGAEKIIFDALQSIISLYINNIVTFDSGFTPDAFWGYGGLNSYSWPFGTYFAKTDLIDVNPGDVIIMTDLGNIGDPNGAAIGMYSKTGTDAPGRVNFSNPLINYIAVGDYLKYMRVTIPSGCYKIGIFYADNFATSLTAPSVKYHPTIYILDINHHRITADFRDTLHSLTDAERVQDTRVGVDRYIDEYIVMTDQFVKNAAWLNGGLQTSITTPNGTYFAYPRMINVNPGDIVKFKTPGYWAGFGAAAIGYYDLNGNDRPGRVNFNDTTISYNLDGQNIIEMTATIPTGVYKIGIFYVDPTATGLNQPSDNLIPTYSNLSAEKLNPTDEFKDLILINNVGRSYYDKGAAPKLPRTKKLCILAAGQSNMDGRVPAANLPAYITLPMSGVNYIYDSTSGTFSPSYPSVAYWGIDLIVAYNLIQRLSDDIYLIKWTRGGTSIDVTGDSAFHWSADYETITNPANALLYQFDLEIKKCVETSGSNFEIGAFIWHQGEGDRYTYSNEAAINYYDNFKKLISYVRGVSGNSRLPVIYGTISHNSAQYDARVEAAQWKIAAEDPYCYCIDMKNAQLLDAYHFNAAWVEYLGEKMFDCLIDAGVITGAKINPSEPT